MSKDLLQLAVRACLIETLEEVRRDDLFFISDHYGFKIEEVIKCLEEETLKIKKLFNEISEYPAIPRNPNTDQ